MMKFTFNYTVQPYYYHELMGISKGWDTQIQKLIAQYDSKMEFTELEDLWDEVQDYLGGIVSSYCLGYYVDKCACMALYDNGVVQYYGEIIFSGSMSKGNEGIYDISENFKEWLTAHLQQWHLYFNMSPINDNLSADVSVSVTPDVDTIQCKAELDTQN